MKCDNCKLCLEIIRVDNSLYWFCDLCFNVYQLFGRNKVLIEDQKIKDKVKDVYLYKLKEGKKN